MALEPRSPKPGRQAKDGVRRETFSFSADPRLVAEARVLVDHIRFHSKSEVIEEGLRLVLAFHRERLDRDDAA